MAMRNRPVFGSIALVAACAALLYGAAYGPIVEAGKPAPPPPPPPPLGTEVYEWHPELGGWLDTSNNVVWGYDSLEMLGYAHNFPGSTSVASSYSQILQDFASSQTDPAIKLAAQNAGNVAAQYTNWRMPTLVEARDAMTKGLFTFGPNGFNGYQSIPGQDPTVQGGWLTTGHWTSTVGKPLRGGFPSAYVYNPATGGYGLMGQIGGHAGCIVVRTHTPTP